VNVKLQLMFTEATPESTSVSVGWNGRFVIDGRRRITGPYHWTAQSVIRPLIIIIKCIMDQRKLLFLKKICARVNGMVRPYEYSKIISRYCAVVLLN